RSITFWYTILHLIAPALVLTPIVMAVFRPIGWAFGIAELLTLGIAFWLYSGHRRSHGQWVRNRIAAEICRSFLSTWDIRRRINYVPRVSMKGLDPMLGWMRVLRQRVLCASPSVFSL